MQIVADKRTQLQQIVHQLSVIYNEIELTKDYQQIATELLQAFCITEADITESSPKKLWSEQDVMLITYGDSVIQEGEKPLRTLKTFMQAHCQDIINSVHILPFFPYSSDDGFSVIDYSSVNESLGAWSDIKGIADEYRLMSDVVLNHCSARSAWFQNFIRGTGTGHDYFYTAEKTEDLSEVIRPRTSELLKEVQTGQGERQVWCTFSHDQVDFDFRNPEVLINFAHIIRQYLDQGIRIFRFDAVAFVWKVPGTPCVHLEQTHEIVRLFRSLMECACSDAMIITETNVPMAQNLSYFGNGNEAHAVYNFPLPPLLLHTMISGDCTHLTEWVLSMPKSQPGTTYLNFIASHDGIGLRPAEGLLRPDEIDALVNTMQLLGGKISWRQGESNIPKAYEINISLTDACTGTLRGKDDYCVERMLCIHGIMLGMEGIPAIYIHSLLGTGNDLIKVQHTGQNRSINRHRWDYPELLGALSDPDNRQQHIYRHLKRMLAVRKQQPAFHPNAEQFALQLGANVFGYLRQTADDKQHIYCLNNVTDWHQDISLCELNLSADKQWYDILSGQKIVDLTAIISLQPYETVWLANVTTH